MCTLLYVKLNNRCITTIHEIIKYTHIPSPQRFHKPFNITQKQDAFLLIIIIIITLHNHMSTICLPHRRILCDTPYKGPQTNVLDVTLNPFTIRAFDIFL